MQKAQAFAPTPHEAPATSEAPPPLNVPAAKDFDGGAALEGPADGDEADGEQDFDGGAALEGPANGDEADGEQDSGGVVNLAMFMSCIDSVRDANANLEPLDVLHLGYTLNAFNKLYKVGNTMNFRKSVESCNSVFIDGAVLNTLSGDAGFVLMMTRSNYPLPKSQSMFHVPSDDRRAYVLLNFRLAQIPHLTTVKFFIAYCFGSVGGMGFKS